MSKKNNVKKAIESIVSGNARGLRKHVNEALVEKVKKALDKKEKELAKNLIESATHISIKEDYKDSVKVAKTELARIEKNVTSNKKEAASAAKNLLDAVNKIPSMSMAVDVLQDDAKDLHKALSAGAFSSKEKSLVDRISKLLSQSLELD